MNRANGVADSSARRIERRFASMNQRMQTSFAAVSRGIAGAFAGAVALRGAQQLIDASTRIENSLKVAGLAGEELTGVYNRLFESAQRNAAPVESLVTLFGRATLVQKELGASTEELLGFTDNVAVALRVAGTDAASASGALLQLSQALGSGTVRAEEFNSIQEGALPILQAVAAGLEEAGGSVAKLRGLVIDGKVSSEAFFRAFEAGSVVLQDKVASSEFTVSQGFVRLQNVLIDTAGRFDTATSASERVGGMLNQLATSIEGLGRAAEEHGPAVNRFLDWISEIGNTYGDRLLANTAREFEMIGDAVDEVAGSFDRYGESVTDAQLELAQAEQALATFATNTAGSMGEVDAAAQDLFQQILEGKGSADLAAEAIAALGDARPDFAPLLNQIGGVIQRIYELRAAAIAAARPDVSGQPMSYAGQDGAPTPVAPKPVSITDYAPPAGSGSGGGGGKKSPGQRFADDVAQMERRIAALQRETELQRTLNPLVDDYGYAVERLRAQMELENAAAEAGLELTPQRQAQIEELASGYAQATAEAARLAEAQDRARETAEQLADAGRQALDSIIDGFIEGKDAGEIFSSVLKDITSNLLKMGINSLLGGFNPLGFLFGGKGFATGTANTGGRRGEPRGIVHGQEAVIPLPSGGKVPVEVRMPSVGAAAAQTTALTVHVETNDEKFSAYVTDKAGQVVGRAAPGIVKTSVNASPMATAERQLRYGA